MTNNKSITDFSVHPSLEKDGFVQWLLKGITCKEVEVTEIKDFLLPYEKEHRYYQDIHIRAEYGGKEHYWLMVYNCSDNILEKITEENQEEYEHVR